MQVQMQKHLEAETRQREALQQQMDEELLEQSPK